MKIGFEAKRAFTNGTGLGHYSRTLISSLATYFSENDYYFDSVNWAYSLGIISGMGNQRFAPSDSITREQLAVMLYNYAKAHNLLGQVDGSSQQFDDSDLISSWAKEAIDYAVKTGLMKGKGNNILDPKGYATRAEVATMLQNFIIIHSKY